jgi:hypothetical protein
MKTRSVPAYAENCKSLQKSGKNERDEERQEESKIK